MVEDMSHLSVIDAIARELESALVEYNQRSNGITDKATLLALRIEQNSMLVEMLRKHLRHLRYMNGEKIEPEVHQVEAVLTAFGSAEMP